MYRGRPSSGASSASSPCWTGAFISSPMVSTTTATSSTHAVSVTASTAKPPAYRGMPT